ncbi:MAG: type II secretion system F family protein [Chlamydiota bacterium]|nr:type II secretion system F family protein [Chlamydiota bacterium]
MPKYEYRARGVNVNTEKSGILEAENESHVVAELEKMGLYPITITKQRAQFLHRKKTSISGIRLRDVSAFMQQLYDLISSGIGIVNALELIQSQTQKKEFQTILTHIISDVREGKTLSEAMAHYPTVFSALTINLVHSGEISGALEKVLFRLSEFYEKSEETRTKIKSAMAYPIFVAGVGLLTLCVLLTFVIPRITSIFVDMGQSLPLVTRFLISLSQIMSHQWWVFILIFGTLLWFLRTLTINENGKRLLDRAMMKVPLLGALRIKNDIARFTRTLETLLSNGVPMIQSLELVKDVISSPLFREEIKMVKEKVSQGTRLKDCLSKSRFLPVITANMIAIGEESGHLENALRRVADSYDRQLDRELKLATSLLEPVLILVIGSIVGLIVMAILLPIFQINFLVR